MPVDCSRQEGGFGEEFLEVVFAKVGLGGVWLVGGVGGGVGGLRGVEVQDVVCGF